MKQNSSGPNNNRGSQSSLGANGLILGATALIAYGLSRRDKGGAALAAAGGLIAFQGVRSKSASKAETQCTYLVNSSPEEAYQLWRNFENLPRFMRHLKSVRQLDDRRSEWTALGPMDREIWWRAEVTEDVPNQRIAWQSLPGSSIQTNGSVEFRKDPLGRGTYVSAKVSYSMPGRMIGSAAATLMGKHPEFMIREDVRRFKRLLETGEVPTTIGQSHGPRGVHGRAEQFMFRESTNLSEPQVASSYQKSA